jgi:hypothetical protein
VKSKREKELETSRREELVKRKERKDWSLVEDKR